MVYQEKKCVKCEVKLSNANFKLYRAKNYIWKCNNCVNNEKREQVKKYREHNTEQVRNRSLAYNLKLKSEDPVKYTCRQMLSSSRKRSKALNLDNNITTDFLVLISPENCPILGFKIKYGGGEKTVASASLDRIDSKKGYTKDNVQVISNLANMMKSEATTKDLINFSNWVNKTYRGQTNGKK